MKLKLKVILIIVSLVLITPIVCADFVPSDKVSFDINTSGNKLDQRINVVGTIPIKAVSGYLGIQYTYIGDLLSEDKYTLSTHLKSRLEGGYHDGHFGLRGYIRYGKDDIIKQDHLIHGGIYLHIDLIKSDTLSVDTGLGTWLEREQLLPYYQDVEKDYIVSTGIRSHLQVKMNKLSVLTEFLPRQDFKQITIRILPIYEIPLFKVAFISQVSMVIHGTIEYRSETHHEDIDPWTYTWTHSLRWKF